MIAKKYRFACSAISGLASAVLSVHQTIQENNRDLQQQPLASIIGCIIPSLLGAVIIYWWLGRKNRTDDESNTQKTKAWIVIAVVAGLTLGFFIYKVYFDGTPSNIAAPISEPTVPIIPVPNGLVEASGTSEVAHKAGLAGLLESERLLGVYCSADSLAELIASGSMTPAPTAKAIILNFPSRNDALLSLQTIAANAKKDFNQPYNPVDPTVERILKNYEDTKNSVKGDLPVKTPIGILTDKETAFACVTIGPCKASDGTSDEVGACAYVVIGQNLVQLTFSYPFDGAESVKAASDALLEWVQAIQSQN